MEKAFKTTSYVLDALSDMVTYMSRFRLNESEFPFCARLHRVKELLERNNVSVEEVISELGQ